MSTTTTRHMYTRQEIVRGTGWASDVRFIPVMGADIAYAVEAAQEAANAAYGDSNDEEIELYRDALEMALAVLGLEMPDADEDEE